MKLFVHFLVVVFVVLFAFIGCTLDRSLERCSEGEREACQCEDGTEGFKSCIDGVFDDCACEADAISIDQETMDDDPVSGDATNNKTTEKDSGEDMTSAADSGCVNTGSDASIPLEAEVGSDSEQRDVASSETGVDSDIIDTNGYSNQDSSEPDSGKDAGTDAGKEARTDAGNETAVYGQCQQSECSGDQECITVVNGTGTYCSIPCETTEDCPIPTSGTAERRCSTSDGMCRLNCLSGDCPDDMECVGSGMRATCVYPQPEQTTVYGRCDGDECDGDQECITVVNGTGTYCSIPCETTEDCPIPTSGTAERRCSTSDDMCRLNCASGDCPEDMECFEANSRSTCVWEQDEE